MEGVLGWEVGMSLCAPKLAPKLKFVGIVCDPGQVLDPRDLDRALKQMGLDEADVEWVVTFSAKDRPELRRIRQWYGGPIFGAAKEVNLKAVLEDATETVQAAKKRGLVKRATGPRNKKPRFEKSLALLEREFGIVRPKSLWVHKKLYGRLARRGSLSPMELGRRVQKGTATRAELRQLGEYMWWETGTMAEITRMIERKEV